MDNWIIAQSVDLGYGSYAPVIWPNALMLYGDGQAHTWRVSVNSGGAPVDLTGYTINGYFQRADGVTVMVTGTATANMATVTLDSTCYAQAGDLIAVLRMTDGHATVTISRVLFRVQHGVGSQIVDPGEVIPNIDLLLAQIARIEAAADAAVAATATALQAAQEATEAATRLSSVTMDITMLDPDEAPAAEVEQTEDSTNFSLYIPRNNVAYATFEILQDDCCLWMHTPNGYGGIDFGISGDGELEVRI